MTKYIAYILIGILFNSCANTKPLTFNELERQYTIDKSKTKAHYNKHKQLDGIFEQYYKMGKLAFKCSYVKGRKEGLAVWYGTDYDKLISYNLDVIHNSVPTSATQLSYFKKAQSNYINGFLEGEKTFFDRGGKIIGKITYLHGINTKYKKDIRAYKKSKRGLEKLLESCKKEGRKSCKITYTLNGISGSVSSRFY